MVLWEIATCEIPVGRDMPPITVPDDGPRELASLIAQCMQHDPARRPTSAELVTLLEGLQVQSLLNYQRLHRVVKQAVPASSRSACSTIPRADRPRRS